MPTQQIMFFATNSDLADLLDAVDQTVKLHYIVGGPSPSAINSPIVGLSSLVNIQSSFDATTKGPFYLIADSDRQFSSRTVKLTSGEFSYFFDQIENPQAVVFRRGCVFSADCLIAGELGTVSTQTSSIDLFKRISKDIKRRFKKVKSFYVGNDAYAKMENGLRLTINSRAPKTYDLRIE